MLAFFDTDLKAESNSSARYPADPDAPVPERVGPFPMAENVEEKQ